MKVLVVDDVPDNVELVCEILEGEYELIRAYNGADAVKLAMAEHPHIIILDVKMSDMDGYQVLTKLKDKDSTRDIPVIFITASYKDPDRVAGGLGLGAVDYITKPVESEILLARVSVAARIKSAEDAVRKSHSELERRVVERTKQLSEANEVLHKEIGVRKRVEQELLWKEKKVEEQAARLKTYVYTAAHFLKVPLTKIQGFSRVLSCEADKLLEDVGEGSKHVQRIKEFSNIIKTEVKAAIDLDLYFLEYANISVLEPSCEKIDLNSILNEVISEVTARFIGRNPVVAVEGTALDLPHNREHLHKAFSLLFTYLITRTPKSANPDIVVELKRLNEYLECTVESRVTVGEEEVGTLFDFLPEINGKGRGLGTELALVKSYIELYGGEILFGIGSSGGRFSIRLRLKNEESGEIDCEKKGFSY